MIRCLLDSTDLHTPLPEKGILEINGHEKAITAKFRWMDVAEPTPEEVERLVSEFHLSHYAIKDCLEPDHLPKYETSGAYTFIIVRFFSPKGEVDVHTIQDLTSKIAFFYNDNFLLTIHRKPVSFMDEIKAKYVDTGYVSSSVEAVVKVIWYVLHSYEIKAQQLVTQIDSLEHRIFLKERIPNLQRQLYFLKRKANVCQRILFVTREVLAKINTTSKDNASLQDVKDLHTKLEVAYSQLVEDVNNLLNAYISLSAQRTNDIVKVLTIFSVFFMPLTFIAGIYGMNFKFMPELEEKWGYPASLGLMVVICIGIYIWFKRRRWL
jgi:magnesium transporter